MRFSSVVVKREMMRSLLALVVAVVVLAVSTSVPAGMATHAAAAPSDEAEIRIGRDGARAVENRYKIIIGPEGDRVTQIGRQLAALSDRPALPWTFKIVDLPDPNAVALPGGPIYVTKGLIDFVRSDHELAAVLAHEVAHTSFRHQMELMRRANQAAFLVILAAILTRDVGAAQGAHLVSLGLLAGYTRDMERQADLAGIGYLVRSSYTPVAALTVMERLRREETMRPGVDPGDLRDHPRTEERAAYIEAELKRRGIPLNRRQAANFLRVSTKTAVESGRGVSELYVNDGLILRLGDESRIQTLAAALNRFFDLDPEPGFVRSETFGAVIEIVGGRATLLRITRDDAAAAGLAQSELAAQIVARLQEAIRKDRQDRRFKG